MNSIVVVVDALRRAPDIVVPLVREIPRAVLKRRPDPRRWSAHEHACHLAHVHALFFERLEHMLREPAAVIRPYLPGEQDADDFLLGMDLDQSLDRFIADRARLVARLEKLGAAELVADGGTRGVSHLLGVHNVSPPGAARFPPCLSHRGTPSPPGLARRLQRVGGLTHADADKRSNEACFTRVIVFACSLA